MIATATRTRTAREYARSSKGKGNRSKSTNDQHTANLAAEQEFGPWTWGEAYADTGSASKYATKNRDDFDRLTADLASGDFGAPGDVLVMWEISRLSREMGIGVKLIDLCEAGEYLIHVTSDERTYNPANANDRHALIAGINNAELEARRLSKRTLRGVNSNVDAVNDDGEEAARPHGVIPFGYAREYGLVDGQSRPISQYPVPAQAEIVIELFRRVLAGDSIRSVALDFQARGLVGGRGKPFSPQTLRVLLTKDAYRGYRMNKGRTVKASWPVISVYKGSEVTADEFTVIWHGVQALLADPTRRTHTGTAIKHVLTMAIRCSNCAGPFSVGNRKGNRPSAYLCHERGCMSIPKDDVDALLIGDAKHPGRIIQYLADPLIHSEPPMEDGSQLATLRGQLDAKRADLKETQETEAESPAHERRLARREERTEAEITTLEDRIKKLTPRPPATNKLGIEPGATLAKVWSAWESAPLTVQREIAHDVLSPNALGMALVIRAPAPGTPAPAKDRIVFAHGPEDVPGPASGGPVPKIDWQALIARTA
ncbi:recombinase family protein [Streptomyces prunicolor]|uniref:recombinase family protein n=1 Tax=Streptomyces prunicolor TaxID=67348 RepID=UPI0034054330